MTPETDAALARLRDAAKDGPGMMDSGQLHADLIDALAEIERLTNLADAERHRVEKLGEMVARLTDEKAAALAEIDRLRAVVHRLVRESNDCAAPCETRCGCWVEAQGEMTP